MTVSVFYPDADPETTSCDGRADTGFGNDLSFSAIRAMAGAGASTSGGLGPQLTASSTTDQFEYLSRAFLLFDTSSLPDTDVVSAAVISVQRVDGGGSTGLGDTTSDIVSSTPASDTNIVAADYGQTGSTNFGTGPAISAMSSNDTYYDWTLNASGIAAVTTTGVSKFGMRFSWDRAGSFTGSWSNSAVTNFALKSTEQTAGTTEDPKLTVTHAAASTFTPRAVVIS